MFVGDQPNLRVRPKERAACQLPHQAAEPRMLHGGTRGQSAGREKRTAGRLPQMDCDDLMSGQWPCLPTRLSTSAVRGHSAPTLNRSMTLEHTIKGKTWKP